MSDPERVTRAVYRKLDNRLKRAVYHKLDNISKIIDWTAEMYKRGLMPPDVARACGEYFSGEDEDAVQDAERELDELANQFFSDRAAVNPAGNDRDCEV